MLFGRRGLEKRLESIERAINDMYREVGTMGMRVNAIRRRAILLGDHRDVEWRLDVIKRVIDDIRGNIVTMGMYIDKLQVKEE